MSDWDEELGVYRSNALPDIEAIKNLIRAGQKIDAIKILRAVRHAQGLNDGLRECKETIERLMPRQSSTIIEVIKGEMQELFEKSYDSDNGWKSSGSECTFMTLKRILHSQCIVVNIVNKPELSFG